MARDARQVEEWIGDGRLERDYGPHRPLAAGQLDGLIQWGASRELEEMELEPTLGARVARALHPEG